MWPCCYLHDDTFNTESSRGVPPTKLLELEKEYGEDWNNLKKHTINDILSHKWYEQVLEDSWNINHPLHLSRCYKNCGDKGIREVQFHREVQQKKIINEIRNI